MCARDKFEKHVFEDVYFGAAHIPSASASCTFELFSVDLTMAMDICSPASPSKFLDQFENPWCLSRNSYVWQKCTHHIFWCCKKQPLWSILNFRWPCLSPPPRAPQNQCCLSVPRRFLKTQKARSLVQH